MLRVSRRTLLAGTAALPFLRIGTAQAARTPGVLTFGLSSYPPTILPWANAGTAAGTIKLMIHRGLLAYDNAGALRGELAASWALDGTHGWIFKLRDAGSNYVVAKPITPKVLLERIFWVAREERAFIECDSYIGPDRRFKHEGPPPGTDGRRKDDLPAEVGDAQTPNMSDDEIANLMRPAKVQI